METNSTEKVQVTIYAKLVDGQLITTCVPEDDPDTLALILADGFKPYDDSAPKPSDSMLRAKPTVDTVVPESAGSLSEPVPTYRDDGDRIVLEWQVLENSPAMIVAEIDRLKAELAATDYQVIKCSEYSLTKRKPPYDVSALHSSRQALRDRIGELEMLQIADR